MHQAGSQSKLISGLKCFYGECKTIVGLLKGNICYTENEKARGGSAGGKTRTSGFGAGTRSYSMQWKIARKAQKEEEITRVTTERYSPDPRVGLSSEQVEKHLQDGWSNRAVASPTKTVGQIVKDNLLTYFNLVFAVLTALLIVAGSLRNLTFLPVVLANMLIGIVQELRAKQTLDRLTMISTPKVTAIREGTERECLPEELVLDDVIRLRAGGQIVADAVVLEGTVTVNEALLTGESDEISKGPGDPLMSGSFVVTGTCAARLDQVGEDSYVSRLTQEAKAMHRKEQSEMIRVLNRLVGVVGILIIPIGAALFVQQYYFAGGSFRDSIVAMVAAVLGMIPEGLYLLASVALAVSVMRLSRQKVLVHDMKCIETLARVDVLCVDKTGTITGSDMRVSGMVPMDGVGEGPLPDLEGLISDFARANPTMLAVKQRFNRKGERKASAVTPFSSAYKYSGAVFEDGAYVMGAPEFVLREGFEACRGQIEAYTSQGYRVLVFGRSEQAQLGTALTAPVTPLALIYLENPVRPNAEETFSFFAQQGVAIKVISGDNPVTVSQVAQQAGIAGAENYVDASTLADEEALRQAVEYYTVFGRVTPEQKRQMIRALKSNGHTVAMTGDGVNDVLALKDADCSVAMASGCDAAVQVSQLVLLESDFAAMPSIVAEGRRVVNNIERSASLFLVKNIFSFLMAVFSVCFMITYPLEPSQISLISMFTIGIPAFFLALQPNHSIISGRFLSNVLVRALPAGITDFLVVGALVVFGRVFGVEALDISTACTMLLAIVGFIILFRISRPMNALRWAVWGACIVGLLLFSTLLGDLFAIRSMSLKCVMLFVVFALLTEPAMRYGTMIVEWIHGLFLKYKEKHAPERILIGPGKPF